MGDPRTSSLIGPSPSPPATAMLFDEPARRLSLQGVLSAVLGEEGEPVCVGRFVLRERIGVGGMGVVYAAFDPRLDRKVAVKLLKADDDDANASRRADRLLREAQAMARLHHPNVVAVHDVGTHEGATFVAMEFVEGTTLDGWLATGRSRGEILAVFVEAGRGLAAAHAAGIVHRDFKPANVLIGADGRVCVSDFGLARVDSGAGASASASATDQSVVLVDDGALTETGALVGTPGYMSPEQFEGTPADARSDQFSFCVALYEALHGVRPFAGDTPMSLATAVLSGQRRSTTRPPGVDPRVLAALSRGLSRTPVDRFPDMDALLRALAAGSPASRRVRRRRWLGATLIAGAAGAVLVMANAAADRCRVDDSALAGTWDDARRGALRRSLAGAGPAADQTLRTIEATLDGWAAAWSSAQRLACEDTRVHGHTSETVLDQRAACLDRLRNDFRATVDVLTAEVGALDSITALLEGLPSVERCANLELLAQGPRPPDDPAAVRHLQAELAVGHALRRAEHLDDALQTAELALAAATALAHGPSQAEALFLRGETRISRGEFAEGVADLEAAALLAEAQRHDLLVAEARVELARVLGQRGASAEERRRWFPLARAAVERLGDRRDPIHGMLAWAEAATLETEERWSDALVAYEGAIALGRALWPVGDDRLLRLGLRRAIVAGRLGRRDEAGAGFEAATEGFLRRWGPDHRWYANLLFDRGQFEIEQLGELALGSRRLEEALAIFRRINAPTPEIAWAHVALAQAAYLAGEYPRAEAQVREGLALLERALGPNHPDTLIVVDNLGAVLFHTGDLDGARAAFTRAFEEQRARLGPEHAEVARLEGHLGEVLVAQGDPSAALPRLERACSALEVQHGRGHLDTLAPLKALGLAHLMLGDPAAARDALTRAREVIDANPQADRGERGEVLWGLARALTPLAEGSEAPALAREAARLFAEIGDPRAQEVAAWTAAHEESPSRPR